MHSRVMQFMPDAVEHVIDKTIAKVASEVESPIEQIFLETLVLMHMLSSNNVPPINRWNGLTSKPLYGVRTQYKLGSYRADFLLISSSGQAVVVECDGHEFHERTKEQAARDRKKDRDIQAAGLVVLRYTGSEIWANPLLCVSNAVSTLFRTKSQIAPKEGFDLVRWFNELEHKEAA